MKRTLLITGILSGLILLTASFVQAGNTTITGINANVLTNGSTIVSVATGLGSGTTIATGVTFTSPADTSMGRANFISMQYRIRSGTAPDVTFKVTTSLDESNFSSPDTGATIKANCADTSWHHAAVSIPVSRAVKATALNNSANSCIVDIILGSQ